MFNSKAYFLLIYLLGLASPTIAERVTLTHVDDQNTNQLFSRLGQYRNAPQTPEELTVTQNALDALLGILTPSIQRIANFAGIFAGNCSVFFEELIESVICDLEATDTRTVQPAAEFATEKRLPEAYWQQITLSHVLLAMVFADWTRGITQEYDTDLYFKQGTCSDSVTISVSPSLSLTESATLSESPIISTSLTETTSLSKTQTSSFSGSNTRIHTITGTHIASSTISISQSFSDEPTRSQSLSRSLSLSDEPTHSQSLSQSPSSSDESTRSLTQTITKELPTPYPPTPHPPTPAPTPAPCFTPIPTVFGTCRLNSFCSGNCADVVCPLGCGTCSYLFMGTCNFMPKPVCVCQ